MGRRTMSTTARERAHNIIDEWHATTSAGAGVCIGYSESEWSQLETLIAAAIREVEAPVLVWSTDKPTVPGWYWWRRPGTVERVVEVHLHLAGILVTISGHVDSLSIGAEWSGPLHPPQEGGAG